MSDIQGETVRKFNKKNLHSEGFTGVEVWKEKLGVIFAFTSEKKGFLHITVTNSSRLLIRCQCL